MFKHCTDVEVITTTTTTTTTTLTTTIIIMGFGLSIFSLVNLCFFCRLERLHTLTWECTLIHS
jgi:hypothetical protein